MALTPALRVYNTLTRRKEPLKPIREGHLDLYVCGMTVYDLCHVGHARAFVAFDLIVRYLRARGWLVNYVRNITDIDDKILRRAQENGEDYRALTGRMVEAMHADFGALGIQLPDDEPRATEHVDEMLELIGTLIDQGHAYVASNGDVYFRVSSFAEYGKLSGRNPDELLAGARIEVGEAKEDPRDFALWKAAKPGEANWPSPWGPGRPGWHIECSAMSMKRLGKTFDIHGGGPDLIFPHHENEIAQSEAATGQTFANCWLHAGALRIDGEKMSKSLGNFFTIRDVVERYPAEVIRYLLVSSNYRSPINWSEEAVQEAREALVRLYQGLRDFAGVEPLAWGPDPVGDWQRRFCAAMDDDFNAREALAVLYDLVRALNTAAREAPQEAARLAAELKGLGATLGLLQQDPVAFLQGGGTAAAGPTDHEIEALIAERVAAKATRDFARADAIRDQLAGQGVVLEDSREGTRWRRA